MPVLTEFIPKNEIGELSEITRYIGLLSLLMGLGYTSQLIRVKNKIETRRLENEFEYFFIIFITISILTFILFAGSTLSISLIAISATTLSALKFQRVKYRLQDKIKDYSLIEYLFIVMSLGFSFIGLYFIPSFASRLIALVISYILALAVYKRKDPIRFKKPVSFIYLTESISVLPHTLLRWIRVRSDVILIGLFFSSLVQADFAIALSVSSLVLAFFDTYNQWFLKISKDCLDRQEHRRWAVLVTISVLVFVTVASLFSLSTNYIYLFLRWESFMTGIPWIKFLLMIYISRAGINLLTSFFNYYRLNRVLSIVTISSSVLYLSGSLYFLNVNSIEFFLKFSVALESLVFISLTLILLKRINFQITRAL